MGIILRTIALALVAAFVTAVFQPLFERWLDAAGFYEMPMAAAGAAMNWIEQIIGVEAFPWAGGVVFGLAAGLWLDPLLRVLDGRSPLFKKDKAKLMAAKVRMQGAITLGALANQHRHYRDFERLVAEGAMLARQLSALGIEYPEMDASASIEDKLFRLGKHFELTAPALEAGDVAAANMFAIELNRAGFR